jgi:hypothetical protein
MRQNRLCVTAVSFVIAFSTYSFAAQQWILYEGSDGPGRGKHIVLVSGDEEYRSEEALPQLGKILATHHGFRCTVLFAIHPESGVIDPNVTSNIPGLEALASADLMIIFTRFRNLPDAQMRHIDAFLKAGKPVIGIRTATHAFRFRGDSPWAHYGNGYRGDKQAWTGGFGRLVLGEKWISHHGRHKHESSRGVIPASARNHPIARGIKDGDIWGPSDVYGVRLPLPGDSAPVVLGQVMQRKGEFKPDDPFFGMRPDDGPPVSGKKNDPMMPIVWTKTYQIPGGKPGRVVTSTIGASTDLVAAGTRRVLVNAAYWCVGMEDAIPAGGTKVTLVGEFKPTAYSSHRGTYWADRNLKPADFRLKEK